MPKTLSAALITAKNQLIQNNPWCYLLQLQYRITTAPTWGYFRLTNYSTTITFNGNIFYPSPLSIGEITENSKGEVNRIQIGISNMEPLLLQKLKEYWLSVDSPLWQVSLWIVDTSQPAETAVANKEFFTVMSISTNLLSSVLECLWVGLGFERTLPGRRYTRTGGFPRIPTLIR